LPLLRAAGHEVYTPTLTGLGERSHLATPEVGQETHVLDVVNALKYEDLHDVILVGHSLGGMVITAVANDAAERLAHLVYLDAIVPEDGQSRASLMSPEGRARMEERVRLRGDGWRNPGSERRREASEPLLGWDAPFDSKEWERVRRVPHPYKALTEPVRLRDPAALSLPRTFIYCTRKPPGDATTHDRAPSVQRARTDPVWRYRELACGHMAMVEAPEQLAELLFEVA